VIRLFVERCSQGRGIFACAEVQQGEEILEFSGPLVSRAELPSPYPVDQDYYLQVGTDQFLGPSGGVDDLINHSCDPNAGVVVSSNGTKLIAIRRIRAGEEIRFDYSTTMDNFPCELNCFCRFAICRGRIRDFLLLPAHVQQRYVSLGIVPDYILAKL
jgi:SET domain-containing protein